MTNTSRKIFVDTGFYIALANKGDERHQEAVEAWRVLPERTKFVTSDLVVSETYTRLLYDLGYNRDLNRRMRQGN